MFLFSPKTPDKSSISSCGKKASLFIKSTRHIIALNKLQRVSLFVKCTRQTIAIKQPQRVSLSINVHTTSTTNHTSNIIVDVTRGREDMVKIKKRAREKPINDNLCLIVFFCGLFNVFQATSGMVSFAESK